MNEICIQGATLTCFFYGSETYLVLGTQQQYTFDRGDNTFKTVATFLNVGDKVSH